MRFDKDNPPPFESVLLEKNDKGQFVLHIASDTAGDLKLTLANSVAISLFEILTNAGALQLEIEKLLPVEQENFPLEIAFNVVRGVGWFKAMAPEALAAQKMNGIFGAGPAQKGN